MLDLRRAGGGARHGDQLSTGLWCCPALNGHRGRSLRATRALLPAPARKPIYFVVSLLRAHGRAALGTGPGRAPELPSEQEQSERRLGQCSAQGQSRTGLRLIIKELRSPRAGGGESASSKPATGVSDSGGDGGSGWFPDLLLVFWSNPAGSAKSRAMGPAAQVPSLRLAAQAR